MHPVTMSKSAAAALSFAVCLALLSATAADPDDPPPPSSLLRRVFRVKKDLLVPAAETGHRPVCVYTADASAGTGKKTIVCGEPAPPTLAALLQQEAAARAEKAATAAEKAAAATAAEKEAAAAAETRQREVEEKCLNKKGLPVKLYLQPEQHQAAPVHFVLPEVHYQQPAVYQRPLAHLVKPVYDNSGGGCYGSGGYYGRSDGADDYRPLMRTVETEHFVNDVPVMRSVETTLPYPGGPRRPGTDLFPRTAMYRPTPVPLPRDAGEWQYMGGYGGDTIAAGPDQPVRAQFPSAGPLYRPVQVRYEALPMAGPAAVDQRYVQLLTGAADGGAGPAGTTVVVPEAAVQGATSAAANAQAAAAAAAKPDAKDAMKPTAKIGVATAVTKN